MKYSTVPRLPAFLADPAPAANTWALVGGRVFDGWDIVEEHAPVVVANGWIVDGPVPSEATVVDLEGRTLMPGLIDCHAHLTGIEFTGQLPAPEHGAEPHLAGVTSHFVASNLGRYLAHGVTTIRDVGAFGEDLFVIRQAARYGALRSPRLLLSGSIVSPTAPGARFFPGMYREADGPDEVRKAVREQIRKGADFVKIMSTGARSVELENPHPAQLTAVEMAAFVDEAHRLGFRAAAHAEGLDGTELAITEKCDTIEHGFHLHRRPDLLARMATDGQTLVPTLQFLHLVAESGSFVELLEEQGHGNLAAAEATLHAALGAGVAVAVGSDSAAPNGVGVEMARMVEHGMTALDTVRAATSVGARALGIQAVVGSVAPGKLADLIVVDGDPTEDVSAFAAPESVWLVLRNGTPVSGSVLSARPPWE